MDPKTQRPLDKSERIFLAQVFLHELDEGVRLLQKAGKFAEAKMIGDFKREMHFSNRLEFLRRLMEEINPAQAAPHRIQHSHKIRNNQWGAVKIRLGFHPALAITEVGYGYKECNEDAFLLVPSAKAMALADGLGGHPGGNIASCIAVDFFEYGIQQGMEMENAMAFANDAILTRSKSDPQLGGMYPMGCTFAAAQLQGARLKTAHVGDTKVMVVREGRILFQTQDHTKGQQLLQEGLVDPPTAFELNHILNRCLGLDHMQAQRDVTLGTWNLTPGDRVLILTDGITDNFFDMDFSLNALAQIACQGSISQAAELLVDNCRRRMASPSLPNGLAPKPDNLSLAMLEFCL